MIKKDNKIIYKELSYQIVGTLFNIYNELGYGYQEKIYERAVAEGFIKLGIKFQNQAPYSVVYQEKVVGKYYLDFIIDSKIVLELKRGDYFNKKNIDQIKGYLAATGMKLAIIAHFTSNGVKIFRAFNPNNK